MMKTRIMLSIREEYDELLKSGMFFEFYPQLSGNYDTDFDDTSFKLNFGKFINEEEYDLDEPEVCMLEIMEGLPKGERIFLPYEFRKKIVEYAERFSDTMTGRGITIRDMALNILKEKSKDE